MMKKILFLCGFLMVALIIAACSPRSQLPSEEGFDDATALAGQATKLKFSPVDSCTKVGDADSSEFVKGTLQFTKKGKSYSYEDKCYKNNLVEYYCKDGKRITRAGVKCENGCAEGRCNSPTLDEISLDPKCYDTDGGIDYVHVGGIYGEGNNNFLVTDTCSGTKLTEWFCRGFNIKNITVDCSKKGWLCQEGKCVTQDVKEEPVFIWSYKLDPQTEVDLNQLWGIAPNQDGVKDITCKEFNPESEEYYSNQLAYNIYPHFFSGINTYFLVPNSISSEDPFLKAGFLLVENWLTKAQEYFGQYPCKTLTVEGFYPGSFGSPGGINIGADGGINHYWLMWHELTHSYFGTHSANALWLREGASDAVPFFIVKDLFGDKFWSDSSAEFAFGGPTENEFNLQSDIWYITNQIEFGNAYLVKNSCDLVPNQGVDDNYLINSYWGRIFLEDLGLKFGTKSVIQGLNLVYAKYRVTGEEITNKDFYDAFLYSFQGSEKYNEAKELVDQKLCQ